MSKQDSTTPVLIGMLIVYIAHLFLLWISYDIIYADLAMPIWEFLSITVAVDIIIIKMIIVIAAMAATWKALLK